MTEQSHSADSANILLVEDNPGDVHLTREAFRENRIADTLHVVADGVEALEFLNRRGEYTDAPRPEIILLDLNLPRKNGDEFLEELHEAAPDISRIPVIILTSSQAKKDIVRSYDLQANAYVTKPVDPGEFIQMIRTLKQFWLDIVCLPPNGEK